MRIKRISFVSGGKNESTTCDCCGRAIQNICYITLADESHLRLGTTCFDKQMKSKLDKMAKRKVNHAIDLLKSYQEQLELWKNMTEEECKDIRPFDYEKIGKYEGIDTFKELKSWMVNEFFPYRISLEEEDITRYAKF